MICFISLLACILYFALAVLYCVVWRSLEEFSLLLLWFQKWKLFGNFQRAANKWYKRRKHITLRSHIYLLWWLFSSSTFWLFSIPHSFSMEISSSFKDVKTRHIKCWLTNSERTWHFKLFNQIVNQKIIEEMNEAW